MANNEAAAELASEVDFRRWYVLRIAPNREKATRGFLSPTDEEIDQAKILSDRLAIHLIARRFKPYIPMMKERRTRGIRRCKVVVERPMFPGYGFVRLNFEEDKARLKWVRQAPGFIDFVRIEDGNYATVPDAIMAKISRAEADAMVVRNKARVFHIGEAVRVVGGPFAGFPASVFELLENEELKVLVDIFGRKTPIGIPEGDIEKL